MKIVCAAICKNEEHNILGLLQNLQSFGINQMCVIDTGSSDNSVSLLNSSANIDVVIKNTIIEPFNFSAARNNLIDIIPTDTDFVLHLDMDERLKSLPKDLKLDHGYAGDRLEIIYNMVSVGMHKLTPARGWYWEYPIHECIRYTYPIIYDNSFVIEHHQRPDKDCYESLTEHYFNETPERLYFHRLTDLIHNSDYKGFADLFKKYGTWILIDQQRWLAVKNYQSSLLRIGEKADSKYFDVLQLANSSSSWYYLFFCYDSLGEYELAKRYLSEAIIGNFPVENERKFFNSNIKNRALAHVKLKKEIYE